MFYVTPERTFLPEKNKCNKPDLVQKCDFFSSPHVIEFMKFMADISAVGNQNEEHLSTAFDFKFPLAASLSNCVLVFFTY